MYGGGELETREQIAARRQQHRLIWQTAPCSDCDAPRYTPCTPVMDREMLAGLAHRSRIAAASRALWPRDFRRRRLSS